MTDEYLTAPISPFADSVLTSWPVHASSPVKDTLEVLADPTNYTHCLDC